MQQPLVDLPPNGAFNRKLYLEHLRKIFMFQKVKDVQDSFSGNSPPSVFVGHYGYPKVNVGILSPPEKSEDAWLLDAQTYWARNNVSIQDIMQYRASLINSRFQTQILSARNTTKFLDISQEIAMSMKPTEVEIELKKKIKLQLKFDKYHIPMGPRAQLKKVSVTENPKIPQSVDKVVSDTDLKSGEALRYLYSKKLDEHDMTKLLSIGVLGLAKNRKLVPTKWSITAIDDTLGKQLHKLIQNYNVIDDYRLYFGNYLGNYYFILFFPEVWSYELFEMYIPGSAWNPYKDIKISTDHELYDGRKDYAKNCVGGYYSNKFAILEKLSKMKRQASILAIRFETPEYWASLGVWVVRESTRKTMSSEPIIFESKEQMLHYVKLYVKNQFNFDLEGVLKKSILLKKISEQRKLHSFF